MNLHELLKAQRTYHPKSDADLFNQITAGLPKMNLPHTIYHLGPPAIQFFRCVADIVKPTSIVEIGFNIGHSATMMLHFMKDAKVTSVDINTHPDVFKAAKVIDAKFGERFQLISGSSCDKDVWAQLKDIGSPTMIFIDGDHSMSGVENDVCLAEHINAEWIAFDDVFPDWSEGTIPAIIKHRLKIVMAQGNMALCKPGHSYID